MSGNISKKHMSCVFEKKSNRGNTNRKLIGVRRGEKCVYERKHKQKNTCRVFKGRKAGGKAQTGSVGVGREKRVEKP